MDSSQKRKDTLITLISKVLILLGNFAIVVFSSRLWGAEGRGFIALFMADLSLIAIFTNVFTNSSISYFINKLGANRLSAQAYLFSFIIAAFGGIVALCLGREMISLFLFIAASFSGLITFHNALFIGKQKIPYYNLITLIQPFLLLLLMFLYNLIPELSYFSYFLAYISTLFILVGIVIALTFKKVERYHLQFDKQAAKELWKFGWQIELSSFLQFFNYRLSYYFLTLFTDISSVGIFSIGVSISESIWIVGRSISLVQYSDVIKEGDTAHSRKGTVKASWVSFFVSIICVGMVLLLPNTVFTTIFGDEFLHVKEIILWLSPGIVALAGSTVMGNYFSAIGEPKILIIKSAIGVVATLICSLLLIKSWGITGACITNSIAYITSSVVIVVWFMMKKGEKVKR